MRDQARLLISPESAEQFEKDFTNAGALAGVQLFRALRLLGQRVNEATTERLGPFRVSAAKYNYLAVLHVNRARGLSASDLGNSVRTTSGSVTVMLDALEREGLVARHRHPTDGRSVVIKLTRKGSQLYLKTAKVQHEFVTAVMDAFGTDASDRLLALLLELGNAMHDVARERDEPVLTSGRRRTGSPTDRETDTQPRRRAKAPPRPPTRRPSGAR